MALQAVANISVDFYDKKYISINTKQLDKKTRFLSVTCYSHGELCPLNSGEHSAYVRYRKSDGYCVFNFCEINNRGKILVELTEQMLAVAGICYADLVVVNKGSAVVDKDTGEIITINNSGILSTMPFYVDVFETTFESSIVESSYEYDGLNDLMERAEAGYEEVIKTSKSWAVGGTGIRSGENTDNAKYYAKQSSNSASAANTSALNAANSEALAEDHMHDALTYSQNAQSYMSSAKTYMNNASQSEANALKSEQNAKTSETKAKASETNSKTSETNAKTYMNNAGQSATNASTSEANAKTSEQKAKTSEEKAKVSEQNSKASETTAATSEANAQTYMNNAKTSENNAKASETNAATSETNAQTYMDEAYVSEQNAKTSETNAKTSETNAQEYMNSAKTSETNALASEQKAKVSETNASTSEQNAKIAQNAAETAENNARQVASQAAQNAVDNVTTLMNDYVTNAQEAATIAQSIVDGLDVATVDEVKEYLGIE